MQLTETKKKRIIILSLFMVVILLYHLFLKEYRGDFFDSFARFMDNASLLEVLHKRYDTWTSRLLIEIPLILLAHFQSVRLWAFINCIMWLILALALMELTHHENDELLLGLILIYPVIEMASAGWIATYINYLWPLAAGCVALISLDKMYHKEKIGYIQALLYLGFELFATNFETVGVMYLCILIWYAVHFVYDRKPQIKEIIFWGMQCCIAVGNILFALTCPGNAVRKDAAISYCMKDFASWSVVDKFVMGVNTTFHNMTESNILYLIFVVVLMLNCWFYNKNNNKIKLISAIPFIFVASRTIFKPVIENYLPVYNSVFDAAEKVGAVNYNRTSLYFQFIVYMIIILSTVLVLLNTMNEIKNGIEFSVIYVAGLLTRITMGFSPTLYASENRTFIFLDFVYIFLIVKMYVEKEDAFKRPPLLYKILRYSFMGIVGVFIVGNLMSIHN